MDIVSGGNIRKLWKDRVATSGDDSFLIYESAEGDEEVYSYKKFNEKIDTTARALHDELGVRKGDHVAIHLPNCSQYVQVWFALMKLGAVAVHSNTQHTPREIEYTLDIADAELLITEPDFEDDIAAGIEETDIDEIVWARPEKIEKERDLLLSSLVENAEPDLPDTEIDTEDHAEILFTSGTTSMPKPALHTHATLMTGGERIAKHLALQPSDRNLSALPLYHGSPQILAIFSSLTAGATAILYEEFKASKFMDQVRKHRATVTTCIGTQVRALMATPESGTDGDNDLRHAFTAFNVPEEMKNEFEDRFDVSLLNSYGCTEALILLTLAPVYNERRWPSIGRPVLGRDLHILDDEGNKVDIGERGEIAVNAKRGRTVLKKYYNMPEKTEEAFNEDGLFLTGDFGRFDDDGFLYFVDRKKNIIETRGENVSEAEVEEVLGEHPNIDEAVALGIPHEIYGEAVKVYIKLFDDLTEEEVFEYAQENLANFKVPEEIEFVDEFPRTSIGKIEKSALREEE
ncbi:AMP-binding protein [Natronomonas sp. CBA1123]|jgi:crotonobetaine/carnitine-CoA ligase|uniref:AMP-binding protein n=1 Tax=Natronomonas sp. CBA1123 TaxID=2668070 RepID=UPI0012EAACDC|nr:AMP-binding protein [Natronomonas sp. CBA1123]MUV85557.1 AMP-binding protein [Natronomonas sp. CBA1123]